MTVSLARRIEAEREIRRRQIKIEAVGLTDVIPDGMSFRAWCEKLGREGMKVDGEPFRLDDRPAMAWIYDQICLTHKNSDRLSMGGHQSPQHPALS